MNRKNFITKKNAVVLSVLSLCMLLCVLLTYSCEREEDEEARFQELLTGVWSYDASGNSTRITCFQNTMKFVSFSQDQWKELADAGKIKTWNVYAANFDYKKKGEFLCKYYDYFDQRRQSNDAIIKIASDGKTFIIKTDNREELWYKQLSEPIKTGIVSFWTARDWGSGSITISLYDESNNFISQTYLNHYLESGSARCQSPGTTSFVDIPYGRYKYNASDGKNSWFGTIVINDYCVVVQIG